MKKELWAISTIDGKERRLWTWEDGKHSVPIQQVHPDGQRILLEGKTSEKKELWFLSVNHS